MPNSLRGCFSVKMHPLSGHGTSPETSIMFRLLHFCRRAKYPRSVVFITTLYLSRSFSSEVPIDTDHEVNLLGTKTTYRSALTANHANNNQSSVTGGWTETSRNSNNFLNQLNKDFPTSKHSSVLSTTEILNAVNTCCRPVQITALLRHGIRYASSKDMHSASSFLNRLRQSQGNKEIIARLQEAWDTLNVGREKQLSETGASEQRDIGQRVGRRLLDIINTKKGEKVDIENSTLFLSSHVERAMDSCRAFQSGLFSFNKLRVDISVRDDLLRFFDYCPRYTVEVKGNKSAQTEYKTWNKGILKGVTRQFREQFEAQASFNMSVDEMVSVYIIAATEYAVIGTRHWLDIISAENLKLMEYAADLKNYWLLGYGYDVNYQQSCPLVSDMFQHLDRAIHGGSKPYNRGVFYFGHAETVIPTMTRLGLYRDKEPLRADNYATHTHRMFRTSHVSPFSSNIAFTLYDCNNEILHHRGSVRNEGFSKSSWRSSEIFPVEIGRYMIMMEVNERPVKFPFSNTYLTSYEHVRKHYSAIIDDCRFNEICSV